MRNDKDVGVGAAGIVQSCMLLFVGALVFGIFAVVRASDRDRDRDRSTLQGSEGALGVLEDRFARGEIDAEEYAERRRILIEGKDPTRG